MTTPVKRSLRYALMLSALATASLANSVYGAADTWTTGAGDGTGNWNAAGNWVANTVPLTNDTLIFGATTGTTTLTDNLMTAASYNIGSITFSAGASAYTINAATPGTNGFTLTGNVTNSSTSLETINDGMTLGAARTFTMTTGGGNLTLGGTLSGAGQIITGGTGTLTLNGNNSGLTGVNLTSNGLTVLTSLVIAANDTVVLGSSTAAGNGGITFSAATGTLVAGTPGLTIANEMWLENGVSGIIGGTNSLTVNGLLVWSGGGGVLSVNDTGGVTFAGNVHANDTSGTARTVAFSGSGPILISGNISNGLGTAPGSLSYAGTGVLSLSGVNTYTGTTTVTNGTLEFNNEKAYNNDVLTKAVAVSAGATLAFKVSDTAVTAAGGDFTVADINQVKGNAGAAAFLGFDTTDGNFTYTTATGGLALTSGITKIGNNTLILGTANTGTAGTVIKGGTLQLTTGGALGAATAGLTVTNGVLDLGGTNQTVGNFNGTAAGTILNSGAALNTLTVGSGTGTGTFSGLIEDHVTGTGVIALAKAGTGIVTLNSANTYSGGTSITAGGLNIQNAGALGSGPVSVTSGGALQLQGGITTASANALTLNGAGITATPNGALESVSGANTYTGLISLGSASTIGVDAGSLTLNNTGTITGSGDLTIAGAGNTTLASAIGTSSGGLIKNGAGTLTLSGASTYSGATSINGGKVILAAGSSLGGTAITVASATTLQIGSASSTTGIAVGTSGAGSLTVNAGGIVSFANNAANSLTINNNNGGATALTLNGGVLTFDVGASSDQIALGAGLLASLSGGNTINLNIITPLNGVQQQLIAWSGASGTGTFTLGTIVGSLNGYSLSLTQDGTGLYLNEASVTSAFWKGAAGTSWTGSNFTTDLAGTTSRVAPIDGNTAVTFVANGASNFANTTLDADTAINSLTYNTGGVTISSGSGGPHSLTINSALVGISVASGLGATTETINSNIILGSTQSWSVGDNTSVLAATGVISDGGHGYSLTKSGAGTLVVSGANTYSGGTIVSGGSVVAGISSAGTSGAFGPNASLITMGDAVTTANNSSPSVLIGGAFTVANPITIANQTTTGIYSIGGTSANAATFAGQITANQGFQVSQVSGGALNITGGIAGAGTGTKTVNFANAGSVNVSSGAITDGAGGGNVAVTQSGAGTTTFSAANTYTGGTTITAGMLALSGSGTLGSINNALTLNGGALDLGGTNQTVGNLTGVVGTTISNSSGAHTLTVGSNNGTGGTYAGLITNGAGTLGLTKIGTGTITISGAETYTGATTINGGILALTGSLTGSNVIANGGSLTEAATSTINGAGVTLSVTNGTVTLAGANTYTGATTIGVGGALNVQNSNALANTSGLSMSAGGALQLSGGITLPSSLNVTLNGNGLTTNGALENVTGTNNFTGLISLAGATTIGSDAGILNLTNTGTIVGGGFGLTLAGAGNGTLSSLFDSSITSLTKSGAGTWTLNNTTPYTISGPLTMNAGTLNIGNNIIGGTLTMNGGTLGFSNAASLPAGTINLGSTTNAVGLSYTGAGGTVAAPLNFTGTTGTVTLANGGTGLVNFTGAITFGTAGARTIQLGNATDTFGGTISSAITDSSAGATSLTVSGVAGGLGANDIWVLSSQPTFTGKITLNGGVLQLPTATAFAGGLVLAPSATQAGILQTNGAIYNAIGTGTGQVNWTTSNNLISGGFAAWGTGAPGSAANSLVLNFGGTSVLQGAELKWAGNGFAGNGGNSITFGSATSNGQVILQNNINMNIADGFNQIINVRKGAGGDSALLSGIISPNGIAGPVGVGSAAGLSLLGGGTLILSGANTYTGYTSVLGGTLIAGGDSLAVTTNAATGVFGNGWGVFGNLTPTASFAVINLGAYGGGGNTPATTVINPTLLTGGAFTIGRPVGIDWTNGTNQTYGIGGNTDNNSTFSGAISVNGNAGAGNKFQVTQVATTGTNALNITGGIVSTATTAQTISFANVGSVNVNTTAISNGTGAVSIVQSGTGTTAFNVANTYTGTTTINAGRILANATTGSSTSSGAVIVNSGGAIGGNGLITSATAVTVNAGGNINLQDNTIGTLSINGTGGLTMAGGATSTLSFDAGTAGVDQLAVTGALTMTNTGTLISVDDINGGNGPITAGVYNIITYGSGTLSSSNFSLTSNTLASGQKLLLGQSGNAITLTIGGSGPATSTTYSLSASVAGGRVMVNSTATISATITNSGSIITNSDDLNYQGLNVSADHGTLTPITIPKNGGPVGAGTQDSGTASLNTTGLAAGTTITLTPTVTSVSNANVGGSAASSGTTTASFNVVANRTETDGTTVNFGRVLAGALSPTQATTITSVTGQDNALTRTTLGTSINGTASSGGTANLSGATAYTFGGANDATNSTTRNLAVNLTNTGNQSGTIVVTPTGEGLSGESVQTFTINYTATALTQRVITNGGVTNLGNLHVGAAVNATSTAFTSTTGDDATTTEAVVGATGTTVNGVTIANTGTTLFDGSTGSGTRTLTGNITGSGTVTGTVNVGVTSNENGGLGIGDVYAPVAISYTANVYSGLATWAGTGTGGSWGTIATGFGTNWGANQGSPGLDSNFATTDTATFTNVTGQATQNVTLDGASPSLKSITFNAPTTSYTLAPGTGGVITLNNAAATITDTAGTHTISADMNLATDIVENVAAGQKLTLSGNISGNGGITFNGSGTTVLSGNNTYSDGTSINAGTVFANGVSSTGSNVVFVGLSSAATLAGKGTIAPTAPAFEPSVEIGAFGTLSPSNGLGANTLTFALNAGSQLQLDAGAKLVFDLGTNSDKINITGDGILSLGGQQFTDFTFNPGAGFGAGTYTLITTASPGDIAGSLGATLTGSIGAGYSGVLSIDPFGQNLLLTVAAVPEPGTWALMLGGLALLVVFQRQQRKKRS